MKPRSITAAEWHHIRTLRGSKMTGQPAHRTGSKVIDPKDPTFARGTGKTYYWCMGQQPSPEERDRIARRCPIKAAQAYLAVYAHVPPGTWPVSFVKPVPKGPA